MFNFPSGQKEIRLIVLNHQNRGDHDHPTVLGHHIPIREGIDRGVEIDMTTVIIVTDVTVTTVIVRDPLLENQEAATDPDQDHQVSIRTDIVQERNLIHDLTQGTTVPEIDLEHPSLEVDIGIMIATAIKVAKATVHQKP